MILNNRVSSSLEDQIARPLSDAMIVDRPLVGHVEVTGKDGIDLLHKLSTNDLLVLRPGSLAPTVFVTDKGRIVDFVHALVNESSTHLLTSPGHEQRLVDWIEKYHIMEEVNLSVQHSAETMVSIVGPRAEAVLQELGMPAVKANEHVSANVGGIAVSVSHLHTFGTHIIHIIPVSDGSTAKEILIERARDAGTWLMTMDLFDTWRCMLGIPAIGAELSASFNPYEAGLRHAISFTKGCYIGQEVIARLDTYQKIQRQLVGCMIERGIQLDEKRTIHQGQEEIGWLTSASRLPVGAKYPCLGIIRKETATLGMEISVDWNSTRIPGTIHNLFERTPE